MTFQWRDLWKVGGEPGSGLNTSARPGVCPHDGQEQPGGRWGRAGKAAQRVSAPGPGLP